MTDIEALVGLNLVMDIGSIRLKRLLEVFGTPQNILRAGRDSLVCGCGIGASIASKIVELKTGDIEREFKLAARDNIKILTGQSPEYPENLKFIPDPPIVLYLKGDILPGDSLGLAIVGSRRASLYGLTCAQKFAGELAESGFTVISGLARGIDTAAHRGALRSHGRTIAVIGSGLKNIYPQENRRLADEIALNGAMLSEFPLQTRPLRQNFPRRNRVISGLSLGVLVVEACRNSGALITANFALDQGREVFCVPGRIDTMSSSGANAFIQQGAKLAAGVGDILEEFPFFTAPAGRKSQPAAAAGPVDKQGLSCAEELLYNIISSQPVSADEVAQRSGLSFGKICAALLSLQLKKKIRSLAGRFFERTKNGG